MPVNTGRAGLLLDIEYYDCITMIKNRTSAAFDKKKRKMAPAIDEFLGNVVLSPKNSHKSRPYKPLRDLKLITQ